jgi:hypothetical protein
MTTAQPEAVAAGMRITFAVAGASILAALGIAVSCLVVTTRRLPPGEPG